MDNLTFTSGAPETAGSRDLNIEVCFGATPNEASDSQIILLNTGDKDLTITLAPGTGIFARHKTS